MILFLKAFYMFRPCWAIFRENNIDTLWLRLYSQVGMCPGLHLPVRNTCQTEDEEQGTFPLDCINATIVCQYYSP
jgi:hypothetical protein